MITLLVLGLIAAYIGIGMFFYRFQYICISYSNIYWAQSDVKLLKGYKKLFWQWGGNLDGVAHELFMGDSKVYNVVSSALWIVTLCVVIMYYLIFYPFTKINLNMDKLSNRIKQKREEEQMIQNEIERLKNENREDELKKDLLSKKEYRKIAIENLKEKITIKK